MIGVRRGLALLIALALVVAALGGAALAQVPGVAPAEEEPAGAAEAPPDPLGRDTPRGLVGGLLQALAADDYERAAQYLDLSALPEATRGARGPELARQLEALLDRSGGVLPNWQLSAEPAGVVGDGLEAGVDRLGFVRAASGLVDVTATREVGPEGQEIWRVSSASVARVPVLLITAEASLVDRLTPEGLAGPTLLGAPTAHWAVMAGLAALALGLGRGLAWGVERFAERAWPAARDSPLGRLIHAGALPAGIFVACAIFTALIFLVGISIVARAHAAPLVEILAWWSLAWLALRSVDVAAATSLANMTRRGRLGAFAVVAMTRRAGKFAIVGVALIAAASALGLNLTGWIAALGIGGLAIALGAQKTIENIVGSLSIIADQPVRVGDFCSVAGVVGTVEDIGIRSTRIRTLDRTIVAIPNGVMSAAQIENFNARDRFRYAPLLGLRYETTPDQIRYLLVEIGSLLYAHAKVEEESASVRFQGFGPSSLDIEIFAYVLAVDWNEFMAVREDLNLRIMDIVAASGTAFALPSSTIYVRRGAEADAGRREAAEAKVRAAAAAGDLPLPRFPRERIDRIAGSIPFPPAPGRDEPKGGRFGAAPRR